MKKLLFTVLSVAASLFLTTAHPALAQGIYSGGSTGNDISYPQCGGSYPAMQSFGIAGVTGGRAFYHNGCLGSEFSWASLGATKPSLYLNINGAFGSYAYQGNTGPAGTCKSGDQNCKAYNFGYNDAQDAYNYAASQGAWASQWWMDVETANSWYGNKKVNHQVILGALSFFQQHQITAGIYSSNSMWGQLMGSWAPGVPTWYASGTTLSGAQSYCTASYNFAGGGVELVQYNGGSFDSDYACL